MQIARLLSLLMTIAVVQTNIPVESQPVARTAINDRLAAKQLLGKHKFNLQWIGWDKWSDFGDLRVVNREGTLFIKGRQVKGDDFLEIDGKVLSVDAKEFTFQGKVVTQVSHKHEGEPCLRDGTMTFKITGTRKYWRLQEMQSPCDTTTDYVDIFLR